MGDHKSNQETSVNDEKKNIENGDTTHINNLSGSGANHITADTDDNVSVQSLHSPDGGYGWVIVIACFYLQGMLDGVFSVFGVFLPQLVDYYEASHGKTAIIGSLLSAGMMLSGPFVSVLVGFIGCQKVAMLGGLLITTGLALSTLAPNMNVLIVTFGLIGGIGLGLLFQPAVVMVGFWFERRRAIAMGISSSGAGIGMLVLSSVSGTLLKEYDWKNALLLVSCIILQSVIFGALLRPVRYKSLQHGSKTDEYVSNQANLKPRSFPLRGDLGGDRDRYYSTSSCDQVINTKTPTVVTHPVKYDGDKSKPLLPKTALYLSHQELPMRVKTISESHTQELHMSNPLLRKDIFYSGSIQNIAKHEQNGGVTNNTCSVQSSIGKTKPTNFTPMKEMLSLHILSDKSFIIIALANALMQAGFIICIYFVTDFGISLGIESKTAAYLISVFGIGTTIGRVSAGAFASLPHFSPAKVTSVSLIIAGVLAICTALLCKTFVSLAICFGLTGFFVAPIIPLTTVILVEYLGIDHLTNAHGMVSLGKGISSVISAPVAGMLMDTMGSYIGPFCITGGLFITAGLLHCLLLIIPK